MLSVRTNFTNRRSGSGFLGAKGSALTSVVVVTMAMTIVPRVPGRKRYRAPGAPASGRTPEIRAHETKISATAPVPRIRPRGRNFLVRAQIE